MGKKYRTNGLLILFAVLLAACQGKQPAASAASSTTGGENPPAVSGPRAQELSAYRIAYFEASAEAQAETAAPIQEDDTPFTMVDFGPVEELPDSVKRPSIYVVFSQPVVPLAKLGRPVRETSLLKIEPPLSGVYRWYGSRLLAFEADDESLPQRRYTVTAAPDIRSLGGKKLEGNRSFSFETERLSVLACSLGDGTGWVNKKDAHPDQARYVNLLFSYPVNLQEIKKWIEISVDSSVQDFTVSRPKEWKSRRESVDQAVVAELKNAPPENVPLRVTLKVGARSESDYLGTKEPFVENFHTLTPFRVLSIKNHSWAVRRSAQGDANPIYIEFSHPVDEKGLEQRLSVDGLRVTPENISVFGNYVVLNNLPVQYETRYTVRVKAGVQDIYGRALPRDNSGSVEIGAAMSYAYVPNTGSHMLEAQFPPKIVWESQNPVSVKRFIGPAAGPYERAPESRTVPFDLSKIPPNTKHYEIEDLGPFMGPGGKGSVSLRWEFVTLSPWEKGETYESDAWLTVQVTDLAVTTRYGYNRLLAWVTRLSDGSPVAGADVQLLEGTTLVREGRTDREGLAVFEFKDGFFQGRFTAPNSRARTDGPFGNGLRIRVSRDGGSAAGGDQVEFIPNQSHNLWRFNVDGYRDPFSIEKNRMTTFLFTDRGLFRPGETATFRAIDRNISVGEYTPYVGPYSIEVSSGAYGSPVVASYSGSTTQSGGAHGSFNLPQNLDPGEYRIKYTRGGTSRFFSFRVANFERLRFEASLSFPDRSLFLGDTVSAAFKASYLAGGALASAPFRYYWTREPAYFNPLGPWTYWRFGPDAGDNREFLGEGSGILGGDGTAQIQQSAVKEGVEGAPYRYRLEASAQDPGRQEIAQRASVVLHPAAFYIGARVDADGNKGADQPASFLLSSGKEAVLRWALVTPEGGEHKPAGAPGDMTVEFIRAEWKLSRQAGVGGQVNSVWERVEEVMETRSVSLSSPAGRIAFKPEKTGPWEARLRARDSQGRACVTRVRFYVSGAGWVRWGGDDADAIGLTPDKALYKPGDTAQILVQSPLAKGKYLITVEREGIISERIVELDGSARTIEVPVEEGYVPVVYVTVSSYTVRTRPPTHTYYEPDLDKPKGLFGLTALYVDPNHRRVDVEISPVKTVYGPGEEAEVTLTARVDGKPAKGVELTFMAVDRGVVDIIDYHVPDPVAFFYDPSNFPLGVQGADSRSLLIDPVTYALKDLQGGDAEEDEEKMRERKDFRPTAVFEPYLVTGADGTVKVRFKLPDTLTTYRCTAVAVDALRFGIQERDLRVSAPMVANTALPRALRWRDTGTVSLILTNLETVEREAVVELAVSNASDAAAPSPLAVDGEASRKVTVAPGSSLEVRFNVAALAPGTARIAFSLRSPSVNERILKELTVHAPYLYETVSTIGSLTGETFFREEGVMIPGDVPEGTGRLSVSLAASRLALLKDTVGYLLDYPYGCLEQTLSRLLPIVAFGDHLEAFGLDPTVKDYHKVVQDGLELIGKSVRPDGGYPYWPGGIHSSYYVSLRAAHFFKLAAEKGYDMPGSINVNQLMRYLAAEESRQPWLKADTYLRAYALWVKAMHGEKVIGALNSLLDSKEDLGVSARAFCGLAALELGRKDLARAQLDQIKRYIRPGTQSLDLSDERGFRAGFWNSDTERYALALMLFHKLIPADDMTTRMANSLLARQRRGYWSDTHTTFWAVMAFGGIADAESKNPTNFNAKAALGGETLAQAAFTSYGSPPFLRQAGFEESPVAGLKRDEILPLRIEREGEGTLYYSASLRYGLPAELAYPRDEGFSVFTEILEESGEPLEGTVLKAGKTYKARVVLSSSKDRTFVALRAPIPSGAEVLDADLLTTARPAEPEEEEKEPEAYFWYYEEEPTRFVMDDEIRFHWDRFRAGKKELVYYFRAVMPGIYPTPPASAECMYEEEVFGRASGVLFRIE